jgi:hypothetical protein
MSPLVGGKMRKTVLAKRCKLSVYVSEFIRASINYKILCVRNIFKHRCKGYEVQRQKAARGGGKIIFLIKSKNLKALGKNKIDNESGIPKVYRSLRR